MADFSKQYCATHDMGFDGDFDIIEEWNKLEVGNMVPFICEGYGFVAIAKIEEDLTQPWLYLPDPFDYNEDGHWHTLDEVME